MILIRNLRDVQKSGFFTVLAQDFWISIRCLALRGQLSPLPMSPRSRSGIETEGSQGGKAITAIRAAHCGPGEAREIRTVHCGPGEAHEKQTFGQLQLDGLGGCLLDFRDST